MNVYELFESMDGIDDSVLERSERSQRSRKRFAKPALIAACCALVLTLLYVHVKANIAYPPPVSMETTAPQETTEDLRQVVSEPYYNKDGLWLTDSERFYRTWHRLTQEEITPLLPEKTAQWMSFTAEAMLLEDGSTCRVFLYTPSRIDNADIMIVLGRNYPSTYDVADKDNAVVYLCGNTRFVLVMAERYTGSDESVLTARATVNGVPVYLEMRVPSAELERAKADFEEMLICVDSFSEAALDLSKVSPSQEAYAWYKPCTLKDVKEDPNIAMLLPEENFLEFSKTEVIWERMIYGDHVSITGYRFGMRKALEWDIFCCWNADETVDMYRLIYYGSSEPVDAIDLTLETIKEFVAENRYTSAKGTVYNNTYNIRFSDHVMVSITIEEVSPRWLYEQLIAVRDRLQQAG